MGEGIVIGRILVDFGTGSIESIGGVAGSTNGG
jgi:hypothetical protein